MPKKFSDRAEAFRFTDLVHIGKALICRSKGKGKFPSAYETNHILDKNIY